MMIINNISKYILQQKNTCRSLPLWVLGCILLLSCSHIDDDDQLIYVAPAEVERCVLIEDFTGQKCINCPEATKTIEALQQQYGDTAVIAVAIHGGDFGISTSNTRMTGLATDIAAEYYSHWAIESQPSGMVNRTGGVLTHTEWAAAVHSELQKHSTIRLSVSSYMTSANMLTVDVSCLASKSYTGHLQLWLVENNIIAPQMLVDGSIDKEYNHQHVFRECINGVWGTDITLAEQEVTQTYTMTIPASYNIDNLNVVAFVYNDNGVENATISKVSK